LEFAVRILIALTLVFSLFSCQSTPKRRAPEVSSASVRQEFQAASLAWQNRDAKRAWVRIKKILENHGSSDVADDAAFLAGEILFEQQQYAEAQKYYDLIAFGEWITPLEHSAALKSVRCRIYLGQQSGVEKLIDRVVKSASSSNDEKLQALELRYELFTLQKKNLEALDVLVSLVNQHSNASKRDRFRRLAFEYLETRLDENEIQRVANESNFSFLRVTAKYRYALMMAEQRNYSTAKRYLDEVISEARDTEIGERAQTIAAQIDARQKVDVRTIGVVLPLSGRQAAIGQKALRGIQHGLGLYGKNPTRFRLAVLDSEGNPDVARRAVERLVIEDNVIAVIGGLLSRTAPAEASKANEYGVPIITMSQKAGITQIGEFVFRNSMTSQMQVERLIDVAMGQLGMSRFAMIFPNDPYGVEFANLFWDEVKARGGKIQGAQTYDPNETDFRGPVQRLTGLFYLDDREDYAVSLKRWKEKNPTRSVRQGGPNPEEILSPIVDFDAIFIPDSARAVGQIAPMLAYHNVSKVRLLGTNIWNNRSLIERGNRFVESAIFVDSFLSNDRAFLNSEFYSSFRQVFGEEPGIFEVQAHDSALLLRQIIGGGETSRLGVAQQLSLVRDFPGALGLLTASSAREIRRPVVSLTVTEGKIVPLDIKPQ